MKIRIFSLGFRVRNFGNIARDDEDGDGDDDDDGDHEDDDGDDDDDHDDDDDCDDDKACDDDDDGCDDDEDDEAGFLVVFIANAGIFGQNSKGIPYTIILLHNWACLIPNYAIISLHNKACLIPNY